MKVLIGVILGAFIAYTEGKGVPEAMQDMANMLHDECVTQIGVDPGLIDKARDGDFAEDRNLKCYMGCLYSETGLFNDDGTLDYETLITMIPEEVSDKFAPVLRKCGSVMGADECETAFNTNMCYYKASPEDYFLI